MYSLALSREAMIKVSRKKITGGDVDRKESHKLFGTLELGNMHYENTMEFPLKLKIAK